MKNISTINLKDLKCMFCSNKAIVIIQGKLYGFLVDCYYDLYLCDKHRLEFNKLHEVQQDRVILNRECLK